MDARQKFALENPLNRADLGTEIFKYRKSRKHATGLILTTILAVDR